MQFVHPQALQAGDTVAVIALSWGGPGTFPHIYEQGVRVLEQVFGLRVKAFPMTCASAEAVYSSPAARAADVHAAFADPEVRAIIPAIGGDDSVRVLPLLDPAIIRANPKIVLGYSDTATLLTYCNQLGLITFNGPSVMAGLAQLPNLPAAYTEHLRTLLFTTPPTYPYAPYEFWTGGYPTWTEPANADRILPPTPNTEGWHWLQGSGQATGRLWGGCIEVLEFLKGTAFWPAPDFWADKILFFETSEEVPTPTQVKYMLRNYGSQGILGQVRGILFGRPRGYTDEAKQELAAVLQQVIAGEFERPDLPLVINLDFGHTDPQLIMPLGVQAEINSTARTLRLLESPCSARSEEGIEPQRRKERQDEGSI